MNVLSLDIGLSTGCVLGACSPEGITLLLSSTLRVTNYSLKATAQELLPILQYVGWVCETHDVEYILYEPPLSQPTYQVNKSLRLVAEYFGQTIVDLPRIYPERKVIIRPSQWKPVVPRTLDLYGESKAVFRPTIHEKDASCILWYWWKNHPWTST